MAGKREAAKQLLVHYFKIFEMRNGGKFTEDMEEEVREIVDLIIQCAIEPGE